MATNNDAAVVRRLVEERNRVADPTQYLRMYAVFDVGSNKVELWYASPTGDWTIMRASCDAVAAELRMMIAELRSWG